MISRNLLRAAIVTLSLAGGARADDDERAVAQARVAQVYTLAELAPILCKDVEADEMALAALLDHAHLTEADLMDPAKFGPADAEVARSFAQSFNKQPAAACASLTEALGENGAGLIRHKPGTPG